MRWGRISRRLRTGLRTPLLIGGCAIWASCGGSTDSSVAPSATGRLEVSPRSVTATTLGQTLEVTVTVGGRTVSASMSLRADQRWLDDRGVLDAAALTNAQLVARAPGRAVVAISAAGQTDSVIASVLPSQPAVVEARLPGGRSHLGDGETIVLRGYRMNQLTAANLNVAGVTVRMVNADSASARLVVPTLAVTGCGSVATPFSIAFNGVQGSPITELSQKRSGELVLAAGQAKRLTDAEAACIRLPRTGSARYLAAYVDTRLVEKAQTQPEFPFPDRILARNGARGCYFALFEPFGTLTNGASISVLTPAGSAGVYRIDDARGGSYSLTATIRGAATDALEWLILRIN